MRGVNLNRFEFDYDLTWAAFFMNANGKVYGRYGGRDAGEADAHLSLAGLKYAMERALAAYRRNPDGAPTAPVVPEQTVEQYPAARQARDEHCIHCHQVYDFRREALRSSGEWRLDMVWVYPLPENVGFTVAVDQGDRVQAVAPDSPGRRAGLRPGDLIRTINGLPVASFADIQYALHRAPAAGRIPIAWERAGRRRTGQLVVEEGWRRSDISWRASMWGLEPAACVHGQDLSEQEKRTLGLTPKALAFRQGSFVPAPSRQAGIRQNDIILGIDSLKLEMTMLQFNAYIRLNYKVGDRITFNVNRNGQRIDVPMVLPARASF